MELMQSEPMGRAAAVGAQLMGPQLMGLELESELWAMELVEPSLNTFGEHNSIALHDILCKYVCGFPPKSKLSNFLLAAGSE